MTNIYMGSYSELYTLVKEQNQTITQNIVDIQNNFSTDDQLFNYIGINLNQLIKTNKILFIIYYILFAGVFLTLFISSKNTFNIYLKLGILFLFAILPFIYLWIEIKIWEGGNYIWSLLAGYVYKNIDGR
jgi:hypothetical protein